MKTLTFSASIRIRLLLSDFTGRTQEPGEWHVVYSDHNGGISTTIPLLAEDRYISKPSEQMFTALNRREVPNTTNYIWFRVADTIIGLENPDLKEVGPQGPGLGKSFYSA